MFKYTVTHHNPDFQARCGLLQTPHGNIETPVFMPVGTRGSVKGILPEQLTNISTQIILGNTYHLLLRPGPDVIAELGGLQEFTGWRGPMLTDSGGFQVFSLSRLNRISEDEVEFASHIDGSRVRLSPKIAAEVQNKLGADIIMAFDECVKLPCTTERMKEAVDRTIRWARQSLESHKRNDQLMFGIVQGGTDKELRAYCVEELLKLDFPGYALGGLSVGESHDEMIDTTAFTAPLLPFDKPRYLMGVGAPRDMIAAIAVGIDMFDCVMPTRNGRHSLAFTTDGSIKLRNLKYKLDNNPLDESCDCNTYKNFSKGYLRHLFTCDRRNPEMAGPILLSLHNLRFYQQLMTDTRLAIKENRFNDWAKKWTDYS